MARRFRQKVPRSKNRKRIPKGMSSESNPLSTRFRNAAHAARISVSMATVPADEMPERIDADGDVVLEQVPLHSMHIHDGGGADDVDGLGEDQKFSFNMPKSMISEGGMTRLSAFTQCTNPTFDRVHREWKCAVYP
uniref:Uncharacterized protein n=1 Tax=Syphacia muris TaxID=451379 RepID=A0A0N5B0W8_9BILA